MANKTIDFELKEIDAQTLKEITRTVSAEIIKSAKHQIEAAEVAVIEMCKKQNIGEKHMNAIITGVRIAGRSLNGLEVDISDRTKDRKDMN